MGIFLAMLRIVEMFTHRIFRTQKIAYDKYFCSLKVVMLNVLLAVFETQKGIVSL